MAITTVEAAVDKLKACRADWGAMVRDRRANARAMLTSELAEAQRQADIIKAADAEAITFLQGALADAATPAALKANLQGTLAFHQQAKRDMAAEA